MSRVTLKFEEDTIKEILRIFEKLEMELREGRDTLAFFVWEGKIVLWSKAPHKKGEAKGDLKHFVRQQLKLTEEQFKAVQDCSREGWTDLYPVIIDTGAPVSVLPRRIWDRIEIQVEKIQESVPILAIVPFMGRQVPEFPHLPYREILVGNYRAMESNCLLLNGGGKLVTLLSIPQLAC
ncbi:MAG: hypothetical protein QME81_03515 [bacterium]|nr:hypothetical protein [bacterium]